MPGVNNARNVLDPISKLVSYALENCNVGFVQLLNVCHFCNKSFVKERDRQTITRTATYVLVQVDILNT